jgi:serine/threonine-protein kinase ATR
VLRGVIKDDLETALYLLPYVLLNCLVYGSEEDRECIKQEILAVLNASAAVPSSNEFIKFHEVSTQRIFYLIDWLSQWLESQKRALHGSKTSKRSTKTKSQYVMFILVC